jgi:hypothetical protein
VILEDYLSIKKNIEAYNKENEINLIVFDFFRYELNTFRI